MAHAAADGVPRARGPPPYVHTSAHPPHTHSQQPPPGRRPPTLQPTLPQQAAQLEARVFEEVGPALFFSDDFEVLQQLGRISVMRVSGGRGVRTAHWVARGPGRNRVYPCAV